MTKRASQPRPLAVPVAISRRSASNTPLRSKSTRSPPVATARVPPSSGTLAQAGRANPNSTSRPPTYQVRSTRTIPQSSCCWRCTTPKALAHSVWARNSAGAVVRTMRSISEVGLAVPRAKDPTTATPTMSPRLPTQRVRASRKCSAQFSTTGAMFSTRSIPVVLLGAIGTPGLTLALQLAVPLAAVLRVIRHCQNGRSDQ